MKKIIALSITAALFAAACATTTPTQLQNARAAYVRASSGPAAQLTPSDLHKAKVALDAAESNFQEEEGSQKSCRK